MFVKKNEAGKTGVADIQFIQLILFTDMWSLFRQRAVSAYLFKQRYWLNWCSPHISEHQIHVRHYFLLTTMRSLKFLFVLLFLCQLHSGICLLTKCQTFRVLASAGFKMPTLKQMTCIASLSSAFNEEKVTVTPLQWYWGLLQLPENSWCSRVGPGGNCNMKCISLLNPTANAMCAKVLYDMYGLNGWAVYLQNTEYCNNRYSVDECL